MSKAPDYPRIQCPKCGKPVDEMRADPIVYEFADSPYYHYEPPEEVLMLPCGCEVERREVTA